MRVILVDPSRTAAKIVKATLEARGHEVLTFADGREALACVKADPEVGALITTTEPLSMSGLELCWETRLVSCPQRPIYVIMMSSSTDGDIRVLALDHGADDFIGKPPIADELYARLRAAERFAEMQRELLRLATTDALTGMCNRRAFFDRAGALCARAREGAPLSAIMADLDHFKRINDTHGHAAGDEVLCAVARALMSESKLVGRLGGEEFSVLVDATLGDAVVVAERLRSKIESLRVGIGAIALTCSFGVSEWQQGDSIDRLLQRTDYALYEAKLGGRNRVVVAQNGAQSGEAARAVSTIRKTA
jgi:diguanylate cyclase (GGDEF)-like protein